MSSVFDTEKVKEVVRQVYGIDGNVTALTGEVDENFRVSGRDGDFVLKISGSDVNPFTAQLGPYALDFIAKSDPSLPVPRILKTKAGRALAEVVDRSGRSRWVQLMTWLPGVALESAPGSRSQRTSCGALAGSTAKALRGFSHPGLRRPIIWDLTQPRLLQPYLDEMRDFSAHSSLTDFFSRYLGILPSFSALPRQALHNDVNLRNLLVDERDSDRAVGLIDFGDVVETIVVADLAIAAGAHLIRAPGSGGITIQDSVKLSILDVVDGYRSVVPLGAAELSVLNWLIAARLASGLLVTSWHRRRHPHSNHFPERSDADVKHRLSLIAEVESMRFV
ncbi:phosphotransferase [Hydrogenophaga sp. YM1]|uniref:phosphotransferase n=1 Tax=Hydrogenophaga sp. YM1 TaxID=2806262 RepID=UPI001959F387|nr:phosphotransferase [Hydrogenophaga sp. YM1]QRR35613.1 phosphotransferase [Hydrogenophaga sp. YM1]